MNRVEITLRDIVPGDAGALAHVLITAEQQTFRGLVPDPCLEFTEAESAANWQQFLTEGLPNGDFMIAAHTETGEVIGYTWGGPYDDPTYRGELHQIAVLPEYQGYGVGRRLVGEVARRLAEQHIHSMRVEVLHVNPNRAFYERLGAALVAEGVYDWDGFSLPNCIYGWTTIQALIEG